MNLTIRAYRFWHIFIFFHNFLLKKQLPWKNRGDTHTFVSGAIYCRMAGKLTLYVWNVDILMKKINLQNNSLKKENIALWKYWHVASCQWQVSTSGFQPSLQDTVFAWSIYSRIHPDSFHWCFLLVILILVTPHKTWTQLSCQSQAGESGSMNLQVLQDSTLLTAISWVLIQW